MFSWLFFAFIFFSVYSRLMPRSVCFIYLASVCFTFISFGIICICSCFTQLMCLWMRARHGESGVVGVCGGGALLCRIFAFYEAKNDGRFGKTIGKQEVANVTEMIYHLKHLDADKTGAAGSKNNCVKSDMLLKCI